MANQTAPRLTPTGVDAPNDAAAVEGVTNESVAPVNAEQAEASFQAASLFPVPAAPTQSKLQAALATAMQRKQAATIAKEQYASHLHDVVFGADAEHRVDIDADADALFNAANSSAVGKELARLTQDMRAEKADMMRKVQDVFGVQAIKLLDEEKFDIAIDQIVRDNATLAEAVRIICAAAGTVRIDEITPVKRNGVMTIQRTFADIGDEEPGQEPIVDVRFLVQAALKASIRFKRLLTEAMEAAARAHHFETALADKTTAFQSLYGEYQELLIDLNAFEAAESERGAPAAFAPPVIRVTDGVYYLSLRPGVEPKLAWAYTRTTDVRKALAFDSVEQAQAILHKISISKFRYLNLDKLEAMRVARVVTEDHGWGDQQGSQMTVPTYPPMRPAEEGATPIMRPASKDAIETVTGSDSRVKSYNVSAHDDAPAKSTKKTKGKGKSLGLSRFKNKTAKPAPIAAITPERQKSLAAKLLAKRTAAG